ncbi:MAG: GntR family transcriptional regulator [Dysosmobacter sp.]|nr:GntR family transcriptional regulator [Dysosmobacter sp.]
MKQSSLSDMAYDYILKKIITFEYKPNDPIIEADICQALNISRTPLREALRRLEAERLVTKVRNRGTFVRGYSQEDIVECCDIRMLFEVYSLQQCIEKVEFERVETVKKHLLALDENSAAEDYYKCDMELHEMITQYCMNSRMLEILDSMDVQLGSVRRISGQTQNRLRQSRMEHLEIVDAIEARDLPCSSELLKKHLENVKKSYLKTFQQIRMNI